MNKEEKARIVKELYASVFLLGYDSNKSYPDLIKEYMNVNDNKVIYSYMLLQLRLLEYLHGNIDYDTFINDYNQYINKLSENYALLVHRLMQNTIIEICSSQKEKTQELGKEMK